MSLTPTSSEQQKPKITIKRHIKAPAVVEQVVRSRESTATIGAHVIIEEDNAHEEITNEPILENQVRRHIKRKGLKQIKGKSRSPLPAFEISLKDP